MRHKQWIPCNERLPSPTPLKGLPSFTDGQSLSVPTANPSPLVLRRNATPGSLYSNSLNRVKCKRILQVLSRAKWESYVFEAVSLRDYYYIAERLNSDEVGKTWTVPAFFPRTQRLMVLSPSPLHECFLQYLINGFSYTLKTMQYPDELFLPAAGNKAYDKDEIKGTPDFTLDMWSFHNTNSRRLVIGECAFTQRDADVTEKLRAYLRQPSDTLVAFKILITEDPPYSTPSLTPSAAKQSLSLERDEFDRANEGDFARVTVGRHTWLSISSVEFHVWIRQPGESSIDVDRLESGGHTVGTFYPTMDVDNLNGAFVRVFQVIKHAALRELEGEHVEREVLAKVEAWSPPSSFLNAKLLDRTLQKSALDTAYARYCEWSARMKTKMKQRRQPLTTPCAPARKPARAPTRTTLPIRSSRRARNLSPA